MNNFLSLIPANGWRIRIFDLRNQDTSIRDVAALALRKDGEVVALIHIINGVLETPPPSSDVWAVDLLGPSDENAADLPLSLLHTKLASETPLDQKLSSRTNTTSPQTNHQGVPKDTRPLDIQILGLIEDSERAIDRGMDTERLLCRCNSGDVLEEIDRLLTAQMIFPEPDKNGCPFYRLTEKARVRLREFRKAPVSERADR
jgi:hypothetical protein